VIVKDSGDPDLCFRQLISGKKINSNEIPIYTDGSRSCSDDGNCDMGCAVVCFEMKFMYRLNKFSSSYTAEAVAILKALDLALIEKWTSINICSDSLSLLLKLKTDLSSIFPLSNLNLTLMKLLLKIIKVIYLDINVRFTWCPAYIGTEDNEFADICAKSASFLGIPINNFVSFKEVMCSFKKEYDK